MSTQPVREIEIEKAWEGRINHARDMYHMAVQAAEIELDGQLARADGIRDAELAEARHDALRAVDGHKEPDAIRCELGHENCTSAWHYTGDVPPGAFQAQTASPEGQGALW